MTAMQLITRVAIRNGWTAVSTRRFGCLLILNYGRNGIVRERVEIRYAPSGGVHSAYYVVGSSQVAYIGPGATGRRAATIRWLKLKSHNSAFGKNSATKLKEK